jgi:hypothetical protein
MAVNASTTQTYQQVGIREDLSDVIYDISPKDTPFFSMARRGKATQTRHEWQTDSLATAANNSRIEGDDATYLTMAPTTRLSNLTQISGKAIIVSGTARSVDTAGREDEFEYQLAKRSAELKRDMEVALTQNQDSTIGTSAVARKLGGLETWYTTNTSRGTNGTNGGFSGGSTSAPGDSTAGALRTFSEALLKTVWQSVWTAGGDPDILMVGAVNKQRASQFTGIATQYRENSGTKHATILGAADVYVGDFGQIKIVANRFQRARTAHLLEMDKWAVAYLRPFKTEKLAKTGDADKAQILVEYTLESRQEAASGVIADLFEGTA